MQEENTRFPQAFVTLPKDSRLCLCALIFQGLVVLVLSPLSNGIFMFHVCIISVVVPNAVRFKLSHRHTAITFIQIAQKISSFSAYKSLLR